MTIVRHDNPFPAIWTSLTGWWEERRQLRQMPAAERRNWKAERDTTRKAAREAFHREWREEHGSWSQQVGRNLGDLWRQILSNIWGVLRHGTCIRILMLGTLIALFFSTDIMIAFAGGLVLHLLLYREIADDDSAETRLARSERSVAVLAVILTVTALALVSPFARSLALEMFLPGLLGWLAPISWSRLNTGSGNMVASLATLFDVGLLFAFGLGILIAKDEQRLTAFRDINWGVCNPLVWKTGVTDTVGLLAALDRNGNVGACFGEDGATGGITPLHLATGFGDNPHHTALLVGRGADIDAVRHGNVTALHDAAARDTDAGPFITMLLDLGADASIRNDEGQTAADVAMGNGAMPEDVLERLLTVTDAVPGD